MRYYSTQRPVGPGTFPAGAAVEEIVNFDERTFCEAIGRDAWGYIDIKGDLSDQDVHSYELTPEGIVWFPVTVGSKKHGGGLTVVVGTDTVTAKEQPADQTSESKMMQFKTRFFRSREEAERVWDVLKNVEITTERVRMSATQGEVKVFINGEYILNFGDTIVLPGKEDDPDSYYGDDIGGWRSSEPDSAFTLGLIWHPFDYTYHYSDMVCRKLGITPEEWVG